MNTATLVPAWQEALGRLGFSADERGYRRDGTCFKVDGRWAWLESFHEQPARHGPRAELDQPGLWKTNDDSSGRLQLFEFPTAVLFAEQADEGNEAEQIPVIESCLSWALETAEAKVPDGWEAPSKASVESWIPQGKLTVQSGALVRQGELIVATNQLAIRFPLVQALARDLPEARRRWLEEFLRDAQNCWRMVRFGITRHAEDASVVAELNLTGAPPRIIEQLLLTGLDGLRWAVLALVETAEFLADATIRSQTLEIPPITQPTQQKEQ